MSESDQRPTRGKLYSLILLMTFLWAANFVMVKLAVRHLPGYFVGAMRMGLAGLCMVPIYYARRPHVWRREDLPRLAGLAFLGVSFNQVSFMYGITKTSVAHAALVIALTPMLVLFLAAFLGQERITARKVAGLAVAISGIGVLQFGRHSATEASPLGDLLIFGASISFALFTVFSKPLAQRMGTVALNTFNYVFGGLFLLPIAAWGVWTERTAGAPWWVWPLLVYMALFPSVVCYLIFSWALKWVPASRLSAFTYTQPLIASALAAVFLGEAVTKEMMAATGLVLSGVWLAGRSG